MTTRPDYYRILQVHPRAEREVVDAAYRRLAAKYHPDVSRVADASERMKQINIAYEVLSDPVKRAAYDSARGFTPPTDTSPQPTVRSRYSTRAWRTFLVATGLMLLAVVALRLAPALLLAVARLLLPIGVISFLVWLLFAPGKPKG